MHKGCASVRHIDLDETLWSILSMSVTRHSRSGEASGCSTRSNRALIEKFGTAIGLPAGEVTRSLDALAKGFAAAKTLEFSAQVQPNDFRVQYREIIRGNAGRIFA